MSYVDLIIKYLSGDLSREESSSFEKELERNEELRKATEEQSAAFKLIRDQLEKRDLARFKATLAEVMSQDAPAKNSHRSYRQSWWFIPPAVACCLAIVLILLLGDPGNERIFARFHQPAMDQVVLAYSQDTRGTYIPGISHYLLGDYRGAMELLSEQYTLDKDNKLIQIYLLLSSLELDRQQEVLEMLGPEHRPAKDVLDQSLCWYSTLALIKSDRREAALERLNPLTEQEGPYQSDAIRLKKVLLK